jgi:hypothetical protein
MKARWSFYQPWTGVGVANQSRRRSRSGHFTV